MEVQEEDAMDVEVQEDEQEGLKEFVEAYGTADRSAPSVIAESQS